MHLSYIKTMSAVVLVWVPGGLCSLGLLYVVLECSSSLFGKESGCALPWNATLACWWPCLGRSIARS